MAVGGRRRMATEDAVPNRHLRSCCTGRWLAWSWLDDSCIRKVGSEMSVSAGRLVRHAVYLLFKNLRVPRPVQQSCAFVRQPWLATPRLANHHHHHHHHHTHTCLGHTIQTATLGYNQLRYPILHFRRLLVMSSPVNINVNVSSTSSSVASTPGPSPRPSTNEVCVGGCGVASESLWTKSLKCCGKRMCVSCLKTASHMEPSRWEHLHFVFDCSHCGALAQKVSAYDRAPTPHDLQRMGEYDQRDKSRDGRGMSAPLVRLLQRVESDPEFTQSQVEGIGRLTVGVVLTRTGGGAQYNRWQVVTAHGYERLVYYGRTAHEALWNLRRGLKTLCLCSTCGTSYRAKEEGCVDCALHASLNPRQKCAVCMSHTPFIYKTKCKHEVCKPCYIEMRSAASHRVNCPLCRAKVHVNPGFVEHECNEEDECFDDFSDSEQ